MSAMLRFDRFAKLLLEAYSKVGPSASWGKAGMLLSTAEAESMFKQYMAIITLAGSFHHDFEDLFVRLKEKKKNWTNTRKEATDSALDILIKKKT